MLAAERIHSPGLCSSCNNASTCELKRKRGFEAIYCETFDSLNGSKRTSGFLMELSTPSETTAQITHLGLCANCENRDSCAIPKPDAGIWHCEEYQ